MDSVFQMESILDEDSVIKRYGFERRLITAVAAGQYDQALSVWTQLCDSHIGIEDMEARIPNDRDRLLRFLAGNFNTVMRISILFAQVPDIYVHIAATHFGTQIESLPIEKLNSQNIYRNMLKVYCYIAKKFGGGTYSGKVGKIVNYILFNLQENLTLDSVAKAFSFSPVYINRILKKEVGMTVVQYIKTQRVALAKMLLHFDDISVSEIAALSGYPDCSYFCRVFKQKTGISPLQYKETMESEWKVRL